jgi:two-component system cell cycle response regulator
MLNNQYKILLIEDNPADCRIIQELVANVKSSNLDLIFASRLSDGLERIKTEVIDAILLDLSLPDSQGLKTFSLLRSRAQNIPILLLTGLPDEELAIQAVREGAQDYLVKDQVDGNLLVRAVNYAIERQRLVAQLEKAREEAQRLTLIDDLTGLYNRRGFFTLSEQQWKLADRKNRKLVLLYCDLDNLKSINDNYGHLMGDQALIMIAQLLKSTFRESDIIARMGGDEFAILAIEAETNGEKMISRLNEKLDELSESEDFHLPLSLSSGYAHYDPEHPRSIEDILGEADSQMYDQKEQRKNGSTEKSISR